MSIDPVPSSPLSHPSPRTRHASFHFLSLFVPQAAWDPFAPTATANGQQQQQQQQQAPPPEDDWGLGELTDADIWGNLPTKKDSVRVRLPWSVGICLFVCLLRLWSSSSSLL